MYRLARLVDSIVRVVILLPVLWCHGCTEDSVGPTSISDDSAKMPVKLMTDRQTILEFKKLRGEELRSRYGAHALGIGWRRIDGVKTDELALVFYVVSSSTEPASSIPQSFEYLSEGKSVPVQIPTNVIESVPAQEESLQE
jgi:hypothetical protein